MKALPDAQFEVVHSLAKWKRQTLGQHDFSAGEGLYTHMKALRPDEERLSPLHSVYVDQWDWERVMGDGERQFSTLKSTVEAIWAGIKATEAAVSEEFGLAPFCRIRSTSYTAVSYCLVIRISMPKGVSGRLRKILARYSSSGLAAS